MLRLLEIAVLAIVLGLCSACEKNTTTQKDDLEGAAGIDELDLSELFNPFYLGPNLDQACLIDVQAAPMGEQEFNDTIDRIITETGNAIAYSNPVRRNRIVYGVSVNCDDFEPNGPYSPEQYFDQVLSFKTINAEEHPLIVESFDYTKELVADLEDAAVAANFDFGPFVSEEVMDKQAADTTCVLNASLLAKQRYGLPFTFIHSWNDSILYVYNAQSIDEGLVPYLVESGLEECGAKYDYEIRPLRKEQARGLSKITVERPHTYSFD